MLCKAPAELKDERTAYFKEQTDNQMKSVDNNLMRENDPRMPFLTNGRLRSLLERQLILTGDYFHGLSNY